MFRGKRKSDDWLAKRDEPCKKTSTDSEDERKASFNIGFNKERKKEKVD